MDLVSVASEFLSSVWSFIVSLFEFLVSNLEFFNDIVRYLVNIVFKIPTLLMSIFNHLPDFMQTGFLVMTSAVIFVLVLKIIKTIRDATI